jgi:hypothetical protein
MKVRGLFALKSGEAAAVVSAPQEIQEPKMITASGSAILAPFAK